MGCNGADLRRDLERHPRRPRESRSTSGRCSAPANGREFGRRMTAVAEPSLAEGLRLAYHHHMGTVVQTEADIDAFMAATGPSVHLLLDTGHATFGGADPAALARRHRDRIAHVHAKDVRADVMARATRRAPDLPRRGDRRRVHGAGRRLRRLSGRARASFRAAIPAGSWSRPSRTRKRRIPSPMPGWATPTCGATSTRRGSREHDGEASPQARRRPRPHP